MGARVIGKGRTVGCGGKQRFAERNRFHNAGEAGDGGLASVGAIIVGIAVVAAESFICEFVIISKNKNRAQDGKK